VVVVARVWVSTMATVSVLHDPMASVCSAGLTAIVATLPPVVIPVAVTTSVAPSIEYSWPLVLVT
jgi:hypothetical protein